jgi:hypothetical protein
MNEVSQSVQLEYKLARGLIADFAVKQFFMTVLSLAASVFFLICAIELLSILGQIGYIRLPTALALVSPLYWMSLLRIWSAFGIS